MSLVEANLHHIRTSFFSKKRFLNALKTSREGNLNSFLLLFLIFCLLSKQNDPTTSAKCARFKTKTLKAKKKYKNKKQECVVIFEQRSCFALVHFFWIFNNIIIVFACNCYVSFFLRVRITQTKKKNETIIDNHRSTSFLDGYEKKNGYEFHWNPKYMFYKKNTKAFGYMTGSCHLDRAMKVKYLFSFFTATENHKFGAHAK